MRKILPLTLFISASFAVTAAKAFTYSEPVNFTFKNFPIGTELSFDYTKMSGQSSDVIDSSVDYFTSNLQLLNTRAGQNGEGSVKITSQDATLNCKVSVYYDESAYGANAGYYNGAPQCNHLYFSPVTASDSGMQVTITYI